MLLTGLVYLKNPQSERRPSATDFLFLTVRPFADPSKIIGGARIPLSRATSFSFNFLMNEKNAVSYDDRDAKKTWDECLSRDDLVLEAIVCSSEIVEDAMHDTQKALKLCNEQFQPISARGISKLVKLDRQDGGSFSVRAAASLALE